MKDIALIVTFTENWDAVYTCEIFRKVKDASGTLKDKNLLNNL